jgi:hypothetical protein
MRALRNAVTVERATVEIRLEFMHVQDHENTQQESSDD